MNVSSQNRPCFYRRSFTVFVEKWSNRTTRYASKGANNGNEPAVRRWRPRASSSSSWWTRRLANDWRPSRRQKRAKQKRRWRISFRPEATPGGRPAANRFGDAFPQTLGFSRADVRPMFLFVFFCLERICGERVSGTASRRRGTALFRTDLCDD